MQGPRKHKDPSNNLVLEYDALRENSDHIYLIHYCFFSTWHREQIQILIKWMSEWQKNQGFQALDLDFNEWRIIKAYKICKHG